MRWYCALCIYSIKAWVLALSGVQFTDPIDQIPDFHQDTRVLHLHGTNDDTVPFEAFEEMQSAFRDRLGDMNFVIMTEHEFHFLQAKKPQKT